ncbi:hypothetical protein M3Y94_00908200 [Aphelenchoides besseyi]|nr:hypothetical protein M3Y94_00908200 [Aphelenchoides besseyi]KAI6223294.1 hypothetical protein M3Y95_00874400 [Aphelenchoides besseyi]
MSPLPEATKVESEENEQHIFALGICILFAWMFVVILCASPQLFRDFIQRYVFCGVFTSERQKSTEKIKNAQEQLRRASQTFLGPQLAQKPCAILFHQVMGPNHALAALQQYRHLITETIPEEQQRSTSVAPSENIALQMDDEDETTSVDLTVEKRLETA